MSTIVEDPGIPLVGRNGGFPMYSHGMSTDDPKAPLGLDGKACRKYDNVGYRLAKRKELYQRRKVICDFALGFALIGIVLMIVETELIMALVYTKEDTPSILIKLCISITTMTLLGFVFWYHALDVKLFMCDNSVEDWRLAMSSGRMLKILLELLIYAIHPVPGDYEFEWTTLNTDTHTVKTVWVPVDVLFSIPMFLRFYLLCRVLMLHSKLFTDASSQSLGALNRIHFNFKFIFKSMMTLYPEYVLGVLMLSGFIIASWALRACEMYHDEIHTNFMNSMWLIAITFLARKLELSRAEKYVHNFVIDVELDKRYKVAAANIVKAGWFVYKNRKVGKMAQVRRHQRKLLKAIHAIRDVKQEQRRLTDNSISLVEMSKSQNNIQEAMSRMEYRQQEIENQVGGMEEKLQNIDSKLDSLFNILNKR